MLESACVSYPDMRNLVNSRIWCNGIRTASWCDTQKNGRLAALARLHGAFGIGKSKPYCWTACLAEATDTPDLRLLLNSDMIHATSMHTEKWTETGHAQNGKACNQFTNQVQLECRRYGQTEPEQSAATSACLQGTTRIHMDGE